MRLTMKVPSARSVRMRRFVHWLTESGPAEFRLSEFRLSESGLAEFGSTGPILIRRLERSEISGACAMSGPVQNGSGNALAGMAIAIGVSGMAHRVVGSLVGE